jgi:hypothetical protein
MESRAPREELIDGIKILMSANEFLWQQIREREAQIGMNIVEASRLMNLLMNLPKE